MPTRRPIKKIKHLLGAAAAIAAITLIFNASYIHAKAQLAQVLLSHAWESARTDGQQHRPWPWADSHPVARLRAKRLGIDQIVLAGDSGRTIAFGPGWAEASAAPGRSGTSIISAHRDTHFDWLQDVRDGEQITLQWADGERDYRVIGQRIADSRSEQLALDPRRDLLMLVTCWPFDAVVSGGPLRYVVLAVPVESINDTEYPMSVAGHITPARTSTAAAADSLDQG
jgi:sortase A